MNPQRRPQLSNNALAGRYFDVRQQTMALVAPLSEADCQVQSMPDASPAKWHLAHTTWFFETFVLEANEHNFEPYDSAFRVLFNSYYHGVGAQHPRPQRGHLSRPSLDEIKRYRSDVDARVQRLLREPLASDVTALIEVGLHHEQQHQELLLTDIKHALSCNTLLPAYQTQWPLARILPTALTWFPVEGGLIELGRDRDTEGPDFVFDNETPRHRHFLRPYALANRLTTHGDWADFVAAGGYREPRWWLSAGWDWVQSQRVQAPKYWHRDETDDHGAGDWKVFTLNGMVKLDPYTPMAHINYFEADAYARWASSQLIGAVGARLPTEAEWEHAASAASAQAIASGNFVDSKALHPMPIAERLAGPMQMFGDAWEWTSSSYAPYPGYQPWDGAVGEYNGKFMVNQYVLRGGSCATSRLHMRATYRNFFPAEARWQFSGLRLARDVN